MSINYMDVPERKKLIVKEYQEKYDAAYKDDYNRDPINASRRVSSILESDYLEEYFNNAVDNKEELSNLFNKFYEKVFPEIKELVDDEINKKTNVFNMFKLEYLSSANTVTRSLNTRLGNFWEKVANLSRFAIDPEEEFGIRLKGVDAIYNKDNKYTYTQIKTKKDTLTGSQSQRTTSELSVYDHACVVACIDTEAPWTYSGPINKLVGSEFWEDILEIDYENFIFNLETMLNRFEESIKEYLN